MGIIAKRKEQAAKWEQYAILTNLTYLELRDMQIDTAIANGTTYDEEYKSDISVLGLLALQAGEYELLDNKAEALTRVNGIIRDAARVYIDGFLTGDYQVKNDGSLYAKDAARLAEKTQKLEAQYVTDAKLPTRIRLERSDNLWWLEVNVSYPNSLRDAQGFLSWSWITKKCCIFNEEDKEARLLNQYDLGSYTGADLKAFNIRLQQLLDERRELDNKIASIKEWTHHD